MKSKLILAAIFLLLGGNVHAFAAKPPALSQVKAAVAMKALAESQNYTVNVSQAYPMAGSGVAVPSMVKIEGNQIYSTLPYIGGGYNTFGNNDGMRFTGTISDYKVEAGKKNKVYVSFTATATTGRVYRFKITIFYNGVSYISTSCNNLQAMRYDGTIGFNEAVDTEGAR